ncbi:MAG TPA: cobalamin B12-binding domain-containing protein [Nocardioidaceae bacterium]|jgi:methylmalonyl-CoA mutase C-terminal domain/subunit|nr:cobalamin B12-binding domain-containing protein [Nocardioidaceae bacterium]
MTLENAIADDQSSGGVVGDAAPGAAASTARARPRRIVMAKPGLDGHDRGAKVVARALRDAGHEVIYTGLHQTPEQIVQTALQEDADAIGLSVLSGAHMTLFAKLMSLLAANDARDIVVFGGGIIPVDDIAELSKLGVAQIFTPGATTHEITAWVAEHVPDASAH